jgi:Rrf2 family protein
VKLTTRSEYALLALVYLARQNTGSFTTVETIAQAQAIPSKYLEQILLALKHARYLRSAKGQRGGYGLVSTPDRITVAEIVRLFDGALAPTESVSKYFYESTPIEREKGLVQVFQEIRDYVAEKLEHTTIADVC